MIFTLDVRRARKGDCLLLHYGTAPGDRGLAMIDGGPAGVYEPHLKPRIDEIRRARELDDDDPLPVDLLMVSHVDDDHIRGILDLTREERERRDARRALLLQVLSFWHNSFDAVIEHNTDALTAAVRGHFGEASTQGGGLPDDAVEAVEEASEEEPEVVRTGLEVLASIAQGFQLRRDAEVLEYPRNPEFDGGLVLAREGGGALDAGGGLALTVVGPMLEELDELRRKHVAWLRELQAEGRSPESALAAYVDKSVANLSSIVVLAEAGGKRMLLTGDARGDRILAGLELVGLVEKGGRLVVDILKVPHHGSANNLDNDFFQRIVASHYVFSGDGEHGNPERESLEMLFRARGREPFTVHLTYPVDEIDAERKRDWEKEQRKEMKRQEKNPNVRVRPDWSDEANGLAAFLARTELAEGQEVCIVDKELPHLIELLDPVGF